MDFLPSADQAALTEGVRTLLRQRFDRERLAAVTNGFDAALWKQLTETGVFSIGTAEADGGLGMGVAEISLVSQELGRACVPGPVVATLVATLAVPGLEPGSSVTLLDAACEPLLVSHLDTASHVLVLTDAGALLASSADVRGTPVSEPVDPHTPLWRVSELPTGERIDADIEWLGRVGATLAAAFQVGMAARCTELAVAYAKEREQFGKTIGSFQAVKHICADMLARAEIARAAVDAAATTLDGRGSDGVGRAVSSAKLLADEAAVQNARACIQVYGGMGFTWEVEVHYYLKRAWVLSTEWGSADDHAEDLAALL